VGVVKLAQRIGAIWRSPRTTLGFVAGYLLFVGCGAWLGWRDLWDVDVTSPGRLVQISTRDRRVLLSGDIERASFRADRTAAFVAGDAHLDVRCNDLPAAALVLTFECKGVQPGDRIVMQRRGGSDRVILEQLEEWRRRVTIPLPIAHSHWSLLPTTTELRYRIVHCELVPRDPADFVPRFESQARRTWPVGAFRVSAGSGWWWLPEAEGSAETPLPDLLYHTRRRAYLILETEQPGKYWLQLPFAAVSESFGIPMLYVNGNRVAYHHAPMAGIGGITAELDCGPRTVIGLLAEHPDRSPHELDPASDDHRPMSFTFKLGALRIAPPE
jgi:hypothetical protein